MSALVIVVAVAGLLGVAVVGAIALVTMVAYAIASLPDEEA